MVGSRPKRTPLARGNQAISDLSLKVRSEVGTMFSMFFSRLRQRKRTHREHKIRPRFSCPDKQQEM